MRRARRGRLEGASRQIVNAQDRREGVQTVEWLVCLDRRADVGQICYTRLQWECFEPSPDLQSDSCFLKRLIRFHVVLMIFTKVV